MEPYGNKLIVPNSKKVKEETQQTGKKEGKEQRNMVSDSFDTPIGRLNSSSKLSECCSSSCRIVHSSGVASSRVLVCDQRNEHQIY